MATPSFALDSSDLIFHLSFDNGIEPDFARGPGAVKSAPTELPRRAAEGVIGKGYLFGGPGGTLEFDTAGDSGRASFETYDLHANLLGESGTLSMWVKPLTNTPHIPHPHRFFSANGGQVGIVRTEHPYHQMVAANADGYVYGGTLPVTNWMHFVMTWRKGETRGYLDGERLLDMTGAGNPQPVPGRFIVAQDGFEVDVTKGHPIEDDAVMDEVQIFRRPLSDEEVRSLFERAHTSTIYRRPDNKWYEAKPVRAFAEAAIVAPVVSAPINLDGILEDWKSIPAHGAWTERRVGVLDPDRSTVSVACDATNLYLAYRCEVDASNQSNPVLYPTGEFLANATERDGNVLADDYIEFALKSKDGHVLRFAVNARGTLLDTRDGDKAWNSDARVAGRSDKKQWATELAIPRAQLGDVVEFQVNRSWKLFRSSQNTLFPDSQCQPGWAKLTLGREFVVPPSGGTNTAPPEGGTTNVASVESVALDNTGNLIIRGNATGECRVKVHGRGFGQEFADEQTVPAGSFEIKHKLEKPGDLGVVVEVKPSLMRSVPVVYAVSEKVELANFPGAGKLEVIVTPADPKGLRATVELRSADFQSAVPPISNRHDGAQASTGASGLETRDTADWKSALRSDIPSFDDSSKTITFDTKSLSTGHYEVVTRFLRGDALVSENRQPFDKKPLPEWYRGNAGVLDGPPIPWTDVKVKGRTVRLLLKEIAFDKTLFPSRIVSNGQSALDEPIRLRIKRNGIEKVLVADKFQFTEVTRRRAIWRATASDGELRVTVNGWIEFDGFTWMEITFAGGDVEHVTLEVPLRREFATLTTLGFGLSTSLVIGDKPMATTGGPYWFGNEKAGWQYYWEHQVGWVMNGEPVTATPSQRQVLVSFPFIQKPVRLDKPRTISFGWAITPAKPVRKDWRWIQLYKGVTYGYCDYTGPTMNYPQKREGAEYYRFHGERMKNPLYPIICYTAFGPHSWAGSPEYAEWWREWRPVPSYIVRPLLGADNHTAGTCLNSSASDLFLWRLERYVKEALQRGVFVDLVTGDPCRNDAHGCGVVDENGVRQPVYNILATRRHYERLYNIMKAADPKYGWVRLHGWGGTPTAWPFMDDNWIGECHIFPLGQSPRKNYHDLVDFPTARVLFDAERWGQLNSWLTEMGVSDGPEKRGEWFGTMVRPPANGKRGEWVLPHWADYEHVAGLGLLHDMWQIGGNDRELPWSWTIYLRRLMRWDDSVRFIGYWQLNGHPSPYPLPQGERVSKPARHGSRTTSVSSPRSFSTLSQGHALDSAGKSGGEDKGEGDRSDLADSWLQVDGAVPEKIACSVFYRPPGLGPSTAPPNTDVLFDDYAIISGTFTVSDTTKKFLREIGDSNRGWLILVPMNNTDADVTLTLRPNLRKLGFGSLRNGRWLDLYRAFDYEWTTPSQALIKPTDPESPHFEVKGREESFPVEDGVVTVSIPKRSFRMLLLEADHTQSR